MSPPGEGSEPDSEEECGERAGAAVQGSIPRGSLMVYARDRED